MSKADVERFVSDLKGNGELLAEVKSGASGVASIVEIARARGYDISVAEAKDYIQSQASSQLSDSQLDAVAGGKGHHHHSTSTATTQTTVAETTEAVAAETTAEVVAEVEIAIVAS